MNPYINKFLVAATAAIAEASVLLAGSNGSLEVHEWLVIALAFLGAFGVYTVPNAPPR